MKLYICEICGDAYIGRDLPSECPFCGARHTFIKEAKHANPIINRAEQISDESKKFLEQTFDLETRAVGIYNCMAAKAQSYDIHAMYKRLAKIEWNTRLS
jgi:rubrerythrin